MTKPAQQPIVLMYHAIVDHGSAPLPAREVGAQLYDVHINSFSEQLQWLKDHQYVIKILWDDEHGSTDKEVVITFDDGEVNNFTNAFPLLNKFGFKAYFFIIVKRVGKPGYMNWEQIKVLHDMGMVIGSHGLSHEILTNLMDTQVEQELLASKRTIERNLSITVDTLSIPRGFCNDKITQMAYDLGYKKIFISDRPKDLQTRCYDRIAVKSDWSLKRFERAVLREVLWGERLADGAKRLAKLVLRESGYNYARSLLLKLFK